MSKRVLISVSNKQGIVEFAKTLQNLGYQIFTTKGTADVLQKGNVHINLVETLTNFPEMLNGRVKTLHPHIFSAILAPHTSQYLTELDTFQLKPFDMVVVNLYPFESTVSNPQVTEEVAIEKIDIGGCALLRAAAKNYSYVVAVSSPNQYPEVLNKLMVQGELDMDFRRMLAVEAFMLCAKYDLAIGTFLKNKKYQGDKLFPENLYLSYRKAEDLRYGENPHQKAAFYLDEHEQSLNKLQGKPLSFNNLLDLTAAFELAREFSNPSVAIIKHNNPCGVASHDSLVCAYQNAYAADPVSAYGGVVGINHAVDGMTANEIIKSFIEVVIAPKFSEEALSILSKKKDLRVVIYVSDLQNKKDNYEIKNVLGGVLFQEKDIMKDNQNDFQVVTVRKPTLEESAELLFGWQIVKHVKSNAIVVSKNGTSLGFGSGQTNRASAAIHALDKAGAKAQGAVLASDGFLPFADTVEFAAKAGITAIIQPGGSIRDKESITLADRYGMCMIFTNRRCFKH